MNGTSEDYQYSDDVYPTTTILDPHSALYWVEAELSDEDKALSQIKQELKGRPIKICMDM